MDAPAHSNALRSPRSLTRLAVSRVRTHAVEINGKASEARVIRLRGLPVRFAHQRSHQHRCACRVAFPSGSLVSFRRAYVYLYSVNRIRAAAPQKQQRYGTEGSVRIKHGCSSTRALVAGYIYMDRSKRGEKKKTKSSTPAGVYKTRLAAKKGDGSQRELLASWARIEIYMRARSRERRV